MHSPYAQLEHARRLQVVVWGHVDTALILDSSVGQHISSDSIVWLGEGTCSEAHILATMSLPPTPRVRRRVASSRAMVLDASSIASVVPEKSCTCRSKAVVSRQTTTCGLR
jgi:hypothetical protein